ncbi:kinesin-like protein 1 [Actinidia rufa]|uniref:Kinesin-like protein 1 n=1 Tax=Actinidia rufa TaxID=165716 RepID=A0A7J0GPF1_9ERIC|nr:kinesin-like protein 1 [Actinidia rufa]
MLEESNYKSILKSSCKNLRGLKGLNSIVNHNNRNHNNDASSNAEEIINDHELAQRRAEEAASRRYQAAEWLRQMDQCALEVLPKEPSEEELCLSIRNGLILCNVLNKINPGAVHKVVENTVIDVQSTEGAAQSAIQYFENMRNFLVAVGKMKLLTFEVSDLEKGGSSSKLVDCILCLKGYCEWKQAGGIGVWRYGGTIRITSFPKGSPSLLVGSESVDESVDESESSQYDQLLEFLHLSSDVAVEESKAANALTFLFDSFGLGLLQSYLTDNNGVEDLPLNAMVIDTVLRKVVKDFSAQLVSEGIQLGLLLKKILKGEGLPLSKLQFLVAISKYLGQRTSMISSDLSKFCTCGGKREVIWHTIGHSTDDVQLLDVQHRQLEELKLRFQETKLEVKQVQAGWEEERGRLGTIRVYCRVRPFLPGQSDGQSTVDYIGENGNIMIVNPCKQGKDARRVFNFNKVFSTNETQQQIYADTQPLIRSVLDGYKVCIFAYGQTGSGKTYTMSGPDLTTEETWGVNYRALRDLFQISKTRMNIIEYEVRVQMIEIYNEQLQGIRNITNYIRNNSQLNGLNVPDAYLVPVKCTQDVLDMMKIGQRNRAVGATALNERSSHSHSILTVHVQGKELVSGSILKGCLHLVDLAGSERVDKSEAVGERLKEAQHINRSLSALGDVISALAQKSTHIPYRNSKLTQVLQDSLGGHAKTLMFVHINPEVNAIGETVSTLKFAEEGCLDRAWGCTVESQKTRTVSPLHMPKYGIPASLKPEISQRPIDDTRSSEVRSCSSGKQMRSHFPSKFSDKDTMSKNLPFLAEERLMTSGNPRSPFPSVRRSLSTDRGTLIKSRIKPETTDNQPITKLQFPPRVSVNKSVVTIPVIPSMKNNARGCLGSQEAPKQDNISDAFFSFQRAIAKKVHPEHEGEQFKQMLNVRQGGIRNCKPESKVKAKNQLPARIQKSDVTVPLLSEIDTGGKMEEARKSDFSEPENEHGLVVSPVHGTLRVKKLQWNSSRNSQNVETREQVQTLESFLSGRNEQKISNGVFRQPKEGSSTAMPEFRRSRSTPRGKFTILP